jgi:ADP-ribose pyrophosphatase YjhB (NUDIX family)
LRERLTARVLLLDPAGRILLMKGRLPGDPDARGGWFTVGGGVEPGESLRQAAAREVVEETGFAGVEIGQVLWRGDQVLHDREGRPVLFKETYFAARCAGGEPSRAGWRAVEHQFIDDMRWWKLAELAATAELVFPPCLARRLADLLGER